MYADAIILKDIKTAFYCKKFEINSLLKYNGLSVDSKAKREIWKELQQEHPEIFTLAKKSYNNRLIYIITEENMPKFLKYIEDKGYTFPIREKRKKDLYYKEFRDRTSVYHNGKKLDEENKIMENFNKIKS